MCSDVLAVNFFPLCTHFIRGSLFELWIDRSSEADTGFSKYGEENLTFLFSTANLLFHFHMQRTLDLQDKSCHTAPNLYSSRQRETKAGRLWFRESNNERNEASAPLGTEWEAEEEGKSGMKEENIVMLPYVIRQDTTIILIHLVHHLKLYSHC